MHALCFHALHVLAARDKLTHGGWYTVAAQALLEASELETARVVKQVRGGRSESAAMQQHLDDAAAAQAFLQQQLEAAVADGSALLAKVQVRSPARSFGRCVLRSFCHPVCACREIVLCFGWIDGCTISPPGAQSVSCVNVLQMLHTCYPWPT